MARRDRRTQGGPSGQLALPRSHSSGQGTRHWSTRFAPATVEQGKATEGCSRRRRWSRSCAGLSLLQSQKAGGAGCAKAAKKQTNHLERSRYTVGAKVRRRGRSFAPETPVGGPLLPLTRERGSRRCVAMRRSRQPVRELARRKNPPRMFWRALRECSSLGERPIASPSGRAFVPRDEPTGATPGGFDREGVASGA